MQKKYVCLAIKKQKNAYEIYNVGRGKGIKIKDLVKKVIKHSKKNLKLVFEKGKPTLKTNIVLGRPRLSGDAKDNTAEPILQRLKFHEGRVITKRGGS